MCNANRYARGARLHNRRNCESDGVVPGGGESRGWKKRRTKRTKHETVEEDERAVAAAAAEVARSGDLYQSQRTPVTMATKLDFFFEVFSALLAGAHSPETGGSGGGKGGSTEETAAVAAAQADGDEHGTEKEGMKERNEERERVSRRSGRL
ncbi:hypothetical protein ALC60_12348 [Trachymyrmex zeteki]|uniref:Uncharacterized protein n=1 Tax=Mycetomoellerius zeteki TaxID=64791 RepID=A0A151WLD9_9HYME|nr:hypothetical protein ALC60_12348 [Trachymyrmex zeteki]